MAKLNPAFKPETLSSDELRLWQKFDKAKVFELLTQNPSRAPDYHEYLQCYWHQQAPPVIIAPAPVPAPAPALAPAPLPPLILPQVQPNVGPAASSSAASGEDKPVKSRLCTTSRGHSVENQCWTTYASQRSVCLSGTRSGRIPDSKGPLRLDRR